MFTRIHPVWFWGGTLLACAIFIWALGGMLLPFLAGLTVAYLLEPLVRAGQRHGVPRIVSTMLILGVFVMALLAGVLIGLPMLVSELTRLALLVPANFKEAVNWLEIQTPEIQPFIAQLHAIGPGLEAGLSMTNHISARVLSTGQAVVGAVAFILLMPIVAFYTMVEWPRIVTSIDNLLPRRHVGIIHDMTRQIDRRVSGFIRGQLIVCVLLAVYYAIGLSLVGLDYGATVGIIAGLLSIVPFLGSIFCLGASVILGLLQVPTEGWGVMGAAVAVFAVGQFIEGNFITPKIVGDRVGLHPLWIIFALLAGAHVMGVLGMLLAVPVAAIIAVLLETFLRQYRISTHYHGGHLMPPKELPKDLS